MNDLLEITGLQNRQLPTHNHVLRKVNTDQERYPSGIDRTKNTFKHSDEAIRIKGDDAKVIRENKGVANMGNGSITMSDVTFINTIPEEHQEKVLELLQESRAHKQELEMLKSHCNSELDALKLEIKRESEKAKKIIELHEKQNRVLQANFDRLVNLLAK